MRKSMKTMASYGIASALLFFIINLSGCWLYDSPSSPRRQSSDSTKTVSGVFYVTRPSYAQIVSLGVRDTIQWVTVDKTHGNYVSLSLCQDTTVFASIDASELDDGIYPSWTPAGVPSGTGYRIRIASATNPTIYDYSASFSITSMYTGTLTVTSPVKDTVWVRGTSNTVTWDTSGVVGPSVKVELYNYDDTTLAQTISSSYSTSSLGRTFTLSSSLASGTNYRIKVTSLYDEGVYALSAPFKISSQYTGTLTVTAPTKNTTWSAGSSYPINWTVVGSIGSYVAISLVNDTGRVVSISSSTLATAGTVNYSVPAYMVTGNDYRIKVAAVSDTGIFAHSDTFSLSGIKADTYEPDNDRTTAAPVDSAFSAQERSLSYPDQDWVSFPGVKGNHYIVTTTGATTAVTRLSLYFENETSPRESQTGSTSTKITQLRYTCDTTGTHYLLISPYSSSYYGDYTLTIDKYDLPFQGLVTAPASGVTWSGGSRYDIVWTPDTTLLGTTVRLYLYKDTTLIQTIVSSVSNGGTYSWTVPATLESGSDYHVVAVNYSYADVIVRSAAFSISGITRDSNEPDNSKTTASSIAVTGTAQARTVTPSDTDWVAFAGKNNFLYAVGTTGNADVTMVIYQGDSLLQSTYGKAISVMVQPTAADTIFMRITPRSLAAGGDYALSVKEYDPTAIIGFTNPTANATWSTGSSYTLSWNADTALFSRTVRLYLYQDTTALVTIASSTINDGSQAWTVTPGLESNNNYRIRVSNYSNIALFGYSPSFTISGQAPDAYEPDDVVTDAHAIVPDGIAENHSLSYADIDWYSFNALANNIYAIETSGSINTSMTLYDENESTLDTDDNSGVNTNARIAWYCRTAGTCYARITGTGYGEYAMSVTRYDSSAFKYNISVPAAGQTLVRDSSVIVTWNANIGVGGYVDIFLYNTAGVVGTIIAPTADSGTFQWTVPATTAPGTDYRIKIANREVSEVFGFSGVFTIN